MPVLTQPGDRPAIPPARWYLRRLRELNAADLLLLARTFSLLLLARAALAALPVRYIFAWKQRSGARSSGVPTTPALEESCRRVSWAVEAVARRSPIRFVCFPQALAAHALLSGAGVSTRLHFCVRRNAGKLDTHAWLEAAGRPVVGGEAAEGFTTVAVY